MAALAAGGLSDIAADTSKMPKAAITSASSKRNGRRLADNYMRQSEDLAGC